MGGNEGLNPPVECVGGGVTLLFTVRLWVVPFAHIHNYYTAIIPGFATSGVLQLLVMRPLQRMEVELTLITSRSEHRLTER